jgi:hypothetical protein
MQSGLFTGELRNGGGDELLADFDMCCSAVMTAAA